ncbi:MAG: RNA polymerase sigma factor [Bacteroidaceae bacterium]|nr:RNA polymerase sigma factor [Bacteroidaceae bacterium]
MEASEFKKRFLPLGRRLYWAAWRLTENREEAEDLVQDVFLRLWTQRDQLPDIGNAEAYCLQLVRRRFLDLCRVRHPETSLPTDISLLPSADDLYYEAELRDQALQARRLIDKLPERQRRIITLRDIEDRPYDEIATTTGLTQVNVRALLSRARKTIRENFRKLTHDGYEK